jgi:hypothetical protein
MPPLHWLLLCFVLGHQSRQEIIWIAPNDKIPKLAQKTTNYLAQSCITKVSLNKAFCFRSRPQKKYHHSPQDNNCYSSTVVIWTCVVMCGWVYVGVFWQLCGCFGSTYTCIYRVLYCLYCVYFLFRLCIFILNCFVCTSVRTTATEWKLNCSK